MAILNSIVVGKARKSAGNATFYQRLGVNCFRQKVTPKENPKFSSAQKKQQKLYSFIKENIDAGHMKPWINLMTDAKRKSGKGQTRFNMFYQAVMKHLVELKEQIAVLDADAIVNPALFFGAEAQSKEFTKGILGALPVYQGSQSNALCIDSVALDVLLDSANEKLGPSDPLFTDENIFIAGVVANEAGDGYTVVYPAKCTVGADNEGERSLMADGTLDPSGAMADGYIVLVVGYPDEEGENLDTDRKFYCTDAVYVGAPVETSIEVTPTSVDFTADGESKEVTYSTNDPDAVPSGDNTGAEWVTITPDAGGKKFTLVAAKNSDAAQRTGNVKLKLQGKSTIAEATVSVTQAAASN